MRNQAMDILFDIAGGLVMLGVGLLTFAVGMGAMTFAGLFLREALR